MRGNALQALVMVATLVELRELSLRSLRTYHVTMLAMLGMLVVVALATRSALPTLACGALFVAAAFVMGQERGAFRRVMKSVRKTKRAPADASASPQGAP